MGFKGLVVAMKKYACLILLLLTILAGCAPGYYAPGYAPGYYPGESYPGESQYGIPPHWYDYDPSMRKWYTPPYFDPHYPN